MAANHTVCMKTQDGFRRCFALVTETYAPQVNGVANTLGHLCNGLLARGHQVQLVRPAQPGERPGTSNGPDLLVRRVNGMSIPRYPGLQWGLPAGSRLRALWKRQRPDAIYLATEGPLGWSALRVARKMGIPVISGFHTHFQHYADHYGLGLLQQPIMGYLRWFHNRTQLTLTACPSQQRDLLRAGLDNLVLLGRGVDCERYHPVHRNPGLRQHWQAGEKELVLLHVGRLAAEKNLSQLVQAWHDIRRITEHPQRLRLVIVGDGPMRADLQQQLPEATFTGWLNGAELAQAYASADIFVFPSTLETFGNVVTEAMASGLAINAFDSAAAHQHIRDRFSGCIAPVGDNRQFVSNLQWLIEDAEGRRGVRIHARHRACQLGWGPVIDRFESYLSKAASGQAEASRPAPATKARLKPGSSEPRG